MKQLLWYLYTLLTAKTKLIHNHFEQEQSLPSRSTSQEHCNMTTEIKEHVLVYHHHYTGKPIVKDGLEVITHSKLFDLLSTRKYLVYP